MTIELVDLLVGSEASLLARTDSVSIAAGLSELPDWDSVGLVVMDKTPWPSPSTKQEIRRKAHSLGIRVAEYSAQRKGPVTAPGLITPRGLVAGAGELFAPTSYPIGIPLPADARKRLRSAFGLDGDPEIIDIGTSVIGGQSSDEQRESVFRRYGHQSLGLVSPTLFPSSYSAAAAALTLALRGIPVLVERDRTLESILDRSFLAITDPRLMTDLPLERELLSCAQRVVAHREHGSRVGSWRLRGQDAATFWPTVSVLVSTNRPQMALHMADQIQSQTYGKIEVVIVAHGDKYLDAQLDELRHRLTGRDVRLLRAPSSVNLGEALNHGAAYCEGAFILKWDDDDYYSPNHIWDLVVAAMYSGFELTAKSAEFVYLQILDITMRRFVTGQEKPQNTVAGGTLLIDSNAFRQAGGFTPTRAAVDAGLISGIKRVGGRIYRTHGFGYILRRSIDGHTWDPGIDYFLTQSRSQWPGVASDEAGLTSILTSLVVG